MCPELFFARTMFSQWMPPTIETALKKSRERRRNHPHPTRNFDSLDNIKTTSMPGWALNFIENHMQMCFHRRCKPPRGGGGGLLNLL